MNRLKFIILSALFLVGINHAQQKFSYTDLYNQAIRAITAGDTSEAQNLFLSSISKFDDDPSYYQLALLYQVKNSVSALNSARENIKKAIEKNETNIIYHLTFATILEKLYLMSELEFDARLRAIDEYEKILEIDSTVSFAWYKLGKFKRDDFLEYTGSFLRTSDSRSMNFHYDETEEFAALDQVVTGSTGLFINSQDESRMSLTETRNLDELKNFIDSDSPLISYEEVANEDFLDAEYYLLKSIETDPGNYKARIELGFLYEDGDQPEKAIPLFKEIVENNSLDKDAHLFLGMLYYETGDLDNSYEYFQNALSLMSRKEFKDYTFYSVIKLLEPILGDRAKTFSNNEMSILIDAYWKVRDPFNLSEYNERVLEHYARVCYSNFRFSIPHRNIAGWQTDMGEMMIRFGEPPMRKKFRNGFTMSDFAYYDLNTINYDYLDGVNVKSEVWYYDDIALAFTDDYSTGNYKFHDPYSHQRRSFPGYGDNSFLNGRNLVSTKPEIYKPKFKGKVMDLPYNAVQLKGAEGKTDVYVNYGFNFIDSLAYRDNYSETHKTGLFFYNKYFRPQFENKETIYSLRTKDRVIINDSTSLIVNSLQMTIAPQYGNCAFEVLRNRDKSVASFHGRYRIKNFAADMLLLSDIIIASQIKNIDEEKFTINRKNYSILPNPGQTISRDSEFFIYYEIYNLTKSETGLTDFTQTIKVERFEEEEFQSLFGLIGSLFELIGLGGDDKIELTSNYQTPETDPQIFLQLDLSDYESGKYLINVVVKDNITQKETNVQSLINWQ